MSLRRQPPRSALAQRALHELDAVEPDRSPAGLMGGTIAFGQSWVSEVESDRDPANANTARPHMVSLCQQLRDHPVIRLHCTCGKGLDYLALAAFSTGVLVVSSPRLQPFKRQGGGVLNLAPVDVDAPVDAEWSFLAWEQSMRRLEAAHQTSWLVPPVHPVLGADAGIMGDAAKRQTFGCTQCGRTHVFLNIQLLRLVLRAIAAGDTKVRLADRDVHASVH